jgi:hypothetical protein
VDAILLQAGGRGWGKDNVPSYFPKKKKIILCVTFKFIGDLDYDKG